MRATPTIRLRAVTAAASVLAVLTVAPAPAASAMTPSAAPSSTTSSPTIRTAVATTTMLSATTLAAPSGVALPRANPRGWVRVWADDFTSSRLQPAWERYSGRPGSYSNGYWSPSHVVQANGMLTLRGYRQGSTFVTGGVASTSKTTRLYGKYLVRFRADNGVGVGYVALLWPTKGWPPEVDFAEDAGRGRVTTSATAHWGRSNAQKQLILRGDFSRWHTLGVEWTATSLKYTVDGRVWGTMTGAAVPHQPMHLAIQSAAMVCTSWSACVSSKTPKNVNIQIDWVAVYRAA